MKKEILQLNSEKRSINELNAALEYKTQTLTANLQDSKANNLKLSELLKDSREKLQERSKVVDGLTTQLKETRLMITGIYNGFQR